MSGETLGWILLVVTLLIYLGMYVDGVNRRRERDEMRRARRRRRS